MDTHTRWSWAESLAGLRPDPLSTLRVERILFGLVRDRCAEIGLREGQHIRCWQRTPDELTLELPGGFLRDLELPYAWFVQVQPLQPPGPGKADAPETSAG